VYIGPRSRTEMSRNTDTGTHIGNSHVIWTSLSSSHRSVSVFNVSIGIQYPYFKISRYRFGISVFQLVHFKGHR